ncbi:metal dependent phosphohydrolase [Thermaerobacter marianensis DSM 12885]|uniref:Metal dependent phosphohydrolase n=1 Tax=Thermaerobacter marianensis (strain ATCC 700841 / DSM 12885 / JCM 10246 / 7p75a) TaxID=644966 RepID=E6SI30_THEM7|nr:HD-GYP domain-containing protein [Thermaerobacter marianensis]ADU50808.1 metal dependent phosphohydrolase [Thermaerobacter marianensis DSM 12885]
MGRTPVRMQGDEIRYLVAVLRRHDLPTLRHSQRVASLARGIARLLGWDRDSLQMLTVAGLLHDVGKLAVDPAILNKPGRLTDEEWEAIRRHPVVSEELVLRATGSSRIAAWVRSHHERWDGGGYPDGLSGTAIPLASRLLALADAFDAMTEGRPYHLQPLTVDAALAEIDRQSARQFDPELAPLFIAMIRARPPLPGDLPRQWPPQ